MSKRVAFAKHNLGYPPWCLDFDPYNRSYLVVGGGGGAGQKEVPNRITLLSTGNALEKVAELDVKDADSPMSLGALAKKNGLYIFAGINELNGKKEHFKSFEINYPEKVKDKSTEKTETGAIAPVGQTSFFSQSYYSSGDSYQRLMRLSPARKTTTGSKRIGAIANSLAPESEIVIFDATTAPPQAIQRIQPLKNTEANDMDIVEGNEEGSFLLAYCTQNEVYATTLSYDFTTRKPKSPLQEPACQYSAPFPDAFQKSGRPKYRCLRFLTPEHILLLSNLDGRSELQVLRIFSSGGPGELILRKKLPKSMGSAVSMDVCALDADATGARQIVIAVAAQAQDVSVYTLDFSGRGNGSPSGFRTYVDLKSVHDMSMKKVALSPFHSPWRSSDAPDADQTKTPGPQYLRLASISLSNTLVVDTLPLQPAEPKKRASRYVLTKSSSTILSHGSSLLVGAFTLLITLLLFQSYIQSQPAGTSIQLLPQSWQNALDTYRQRAVEVSSPLTRRVHTVSDDIAESTSHASKSILDLLHIHHKSQHLPDPEKKAIILSAPEEGTELSHHVLSEGGHEAVLAHDVNAKRWEDLSKGQQKAWKDRLVGAGAWSADYGETILKGVFFSEIAGAVGRAAAEALAG